MSSSELLPLFPSATHPALPVATQILSTLRHLTAPGRGNDLKPEERAALVGVSALLGCERLQLKDLIESSAQKASSVSPSHFRSALSLSRKILSTIDIDSPLSSPSKNQRRTSSNTPSSTSPSKIQPVPLITSTPKKKFRYSSGIDLSGLVSRSGGKTNENSPRISSPLKQSVTPSKSQSRNRNILEQNEERVESEDEEMQTPTKKLRFTDPRPEAVFAESSTSRKRKEDVSAFFSLRPGSLSAGKTGLTVSEKAPLFPTREELGFVSPRNRRTSLEIRERRSRKVKPRRDWTYCETFWGGEEVSSRNSKILDELGEKLPKWCEEHSLPPLEKTISSTLSLSDILMVPLETSSRGRNGDVGH